ncbi:LOG family protein [bacterium]|nr:LOG family protein [bacterium]
MQIAVFGGGNWQKGSDVWSLGLDVGARIAHAGHTVVTGGYGGCMAAVSEGAVKAGGKAIGILHSPESILPPNPFVTDTIVTTDYQSRLAELLRVPSALALPGSSGTFAEIAVSAALLKRNANRHLALWSDWWEPRIRVILESLSVSLSQGLTWVDTLDSLGVWLQHLQGQRSIPQTNLSEGK